MLQYPGKTGLRTVENSLLCLLGAGGPLLLELRLLIWLGSSKLCVSAWKDRIYLLEVLSGLL